MPGDPSALVAPRIQRTESAGVIRARLWIVHLASLGVFFVPITRELLIATVIGYFVRVFAWEAGSHRYFSHRSFKTSRLFQFVLGALSAAGGQRGPLWWAAMHRQHHRSSDTVADVHSPVTHAFLTAHMGWLCDPRTVDTDLDAVRDLARHREPVWLNKYHYLFSIAALLGVFALGQYTPLFGRTGLGWAAVVWVFFVGTLLSLYASFAVNTLTHGRRVGFFNRRRFDSGDTTTNSALLAIPTLGVLWLLSKLGIVWDLHRVPEAVLAEGRQS